MATDQPTTRDTRSITYRPRPTDSDTGRYDLDHFDGFSADLSDEDGVSLIAVLAASPRWEDRVRAEVLRRRSKITLPDQFPCIYQTPDSPNRAGSKNPQPTPWVVSPDIAMLTSLLPDYQELWDSYTSRWGPGARRTFAVGRLDGLPTHNVYRPGTTPAQVLHSTLLTHSAMYTRAPERLRELRL
ncbi:hypothetical protein [Mycolicibacterium aubagnense]|uniref:Transcriptional regulator n=1 Tax=Mycolicibacterium aubagnense TaxID=319707 RepID=A0ABM7I6R5_9MYCO|nr:hypothetical protein [Mycolicibacterium aubagnense]TLH48979.1 hypothetical protein C1S80_29290 [Mycolicibacterium aubagnense]BBX82235.1 hypothetical protein MAUB_01080 [Mycolicibacterium aubagnense]